VHRAEFSDHERRRRSRLAQTIHQSRFLRSRCETFAVANPVVAARKGSSMIVCTWFDGKGGSCASCSFLGNGKGASGRRLRTTKRCNS